MNPLRFCLSLSALALLALAGCTTAPNRPTSDTEVKWLTAAERGDIEGMLELAELYERWNDRRALDWYERAAAATPWTFRNTIAEEALGRIWASGEMYTGRRPEDTPPPVLRASPRKAERWYLAAANHGSPGAMLSLAKFERERGHAAAALRWDLRATVYQRYSTSSSGLPAAIAPQAGALHPLVVDIQRRAARGDAEAEVDLGALYERGMGLGIERDPAVALQWYRKAALQGNVFGQYFTGLMLGRAPPGVPRDEEAAAGWFAKAEAQKFFLAGESYWRKGIQPAFWTYD
ncbi:tetratricopeptide repeat protein [Stenotrophomonas sp. NPDC047960]|jgi:TPR repeat protein|uniref:tetratricopeptide repeat protein n=1 Tax=Stenotrophomonas sp. NPDC047960 TaxID=3364531 RepID=UPI003721D19E